MPVASGSRITAGLALVSASVVSAAPAMASQPHPLMSTQAVNLTADSSLLNIAHNAVNAVLNAPMTQLEGVQVLTAAMELSASWWVYSPTNVLGWDPANPGMAKGITQILLPFKALSTPVGDAVNAWFAANLPMNVGCTGIPPCPDFSGLINSMFKVSWLDLYTKGYTFDQPYYAHNPVSAGEGYWGQELGQIGDPVAWYGQTVKLNIMDVPNSIKAYLTGTPGPVRIPTLGEVVTTYARLARSLWNSFYPFVPTSYMWDPATSLSAYLTRPFSALLCPTCNPYDPYMPVDWKPGDPTAPGGYVPVIKKKWAAPGSTTPAAETVSGTVVAPPSGAGPDDPDSPHDVAGAVSHRTLRTAIAAAATVRAARRSADSAASLAAPKPAAQAADAESAESPRVSRRAVSAARSGVSVGSVE